MATFDYVTSGSPAAQFPSVPTPQGFALALDSKNVVLYVAIQGVWRQVSSGGGGGSSTLAGLTDVAISSPQNGQVLTYNSGAGKWENENAAGGGGVNIGSVGQTSPSPVYSPNEAPAGDAVTGFVEDVNGFWHQQFGVDVTTSLVNKVWAATTLFVIRDSIVDQVGNIQVITTGGTTGSSEPTFGTTLGATTTDGSAVWTCRGLNAQPGAMSIYRRTYFRDDQATTMANGNALVAVQHKVGSGTNGGSKQDHGVVINTYNDPSDPGPIYSMVGIQCQTELNGAPAFQPVIDGEISCASYQMADSHTGTLDPPPLGVSCTRMQYFREAGAGTWNSVGPAAVRLLCSNLSTVDFEFQEMDGMTVLCNDASGSPNHIIGAGIRIQAPAAHGNRMDTANFGLVVEDFGHTQGNDFAIRVLGGTSTLGVGIFSQFTVATLPTGGNITEGAQAYATDGRKVGEGAGLGTGVPVYFSNSQWRTYSTDAQVQA